jgi:hypothetical protein
MACQPTCTLAGATSPGSSSEAAPFFRGSCRNTQSLWAKTSSASWRIARTGLTRTKTLTSQSSFDLFIQVTVIVLEQPGDAQAGLPLLQAEAVNGAILDVIFELGLGLVENLVDGVAKLHDEPSVSDCEDVARLEALGLL